MKCCAFLFGLCFLLTGYSQSSSLLYANLGLNRVGLLYDFGGIYQYNLHQFSVGLRFYEPDQVFEKDLPGLQLAYLFQMPGQKRFNLFAGAEFIYFQEKKSDSQFRLFDPKVVFGGVWTLKSAFKIKTDFSIGSIHTYSTNFLTNKTTHFTYLNYEIKAGFIYQFRVRN